MISYTQLHALSDELDSCKLKTTQVQKEEAICLEAEEVRAEVAFLRAKLQGVGGLGEVTDAERGSSTASTLAHTQENPPPNRVTRINAPVFRPTMGSPSTSTAPPSTLLVL